MAAYAALISLMNTIEQIMNHPFLSISFDEEQIKSLLEKIVFLQEFMDNRSHGLTREEAEILESQIASAAHAAEDAIESHVADQILEGSNETSSIFLLEEGVLDDIDTIKKKVVKVKDEGGFKGMQPYSILASSSRYHTIEKSAMVGFDDYLIQLMDKLTGLHSNQNVIPIVGMGGIGKTTLAKNVFEKSLIMQFFDIRAWATVSQNYSVRDLLLELLSSIVENMDNFIALEEHQLGEGLYKRLWGRRYLIILDDIWDFKAWEKINLYFPEKGNGSRIVVTTRLMGVALQFGYSYLTINFLDEDQSWNLLCKRAFGQQDCPTELEKVGKKIAKNCKGLPLSIVVIGGFLRKSNLSQEFWESVANDTNSILNSGGEEQCLDILSLSYFHLPAHLKPCFLYMGVFPEDEKIRVSRLIKFWVAEGFLKPKEIQSLEEVGESYLQDLVDRNLILVCSWGSNGKIKDCNFHDLLRELCLKIAERENFLCVMKLVDTSRATDKERRIVIHESLSGNKAFAMYMESAPLVRSLVCRGNWRWRFNFRLLRVLNTIDEGFVESDSMCVNLRCIDRRFVWFMDDKVTSTGWHLPSLYVPKTISVFWNLQTISIKGCSKQEFALSDIWEMPQLRHIKVDVFKLHYPPRSDEIVLVLKNLQTISTIENLRLSEEVCKRIPNIKKLRILYSDLWREHEPNSLYCPNNLSRLHKLQSLNICFSDLTCGRDLFLNLTFPHSLQKLSLYECKIYWEDLSTIGSLPHLEVLKLEFKSVTGTEWNPVEGEFACLKFLLCSCNDLTTWNADNFHFPVIETIVLEQLSELDMIPPGIAEIPTLGLIRLNNCSLSCAISAVEILADQHENFGNDDLQLEVQFALQAKMMKFKKKLEQEGFECNNLHLKYVVS